MENFNNKQKLILGVLAVILITVVIIYIFKKDTSTVYSEYENVYASNLTNDTTEENQNSTNEAENKMFVHIAGEVQNPGIFEVDENTRIADLIELAGGLTKKGSIKNVNLAYKVEDGQKIYIPSIDEEAKQAEIEYVTESSGVSIERTK